jgi:surfactin synthase thioesterase subunit/glycosyltransferase involved in cell wall biosynthesis
MRILLAHNSPYYPAHGGGDRSNRLLMEALASRGHHCRVIGRTGSYGSKAQEDLVRDLSARGIRLLSSGSGVVLLRLNGVEVHTVANHPNLRGYFTEQIGDFAPDVILSSTDDPAQVLLEAALRAEASRVVYLARATLPLPFGPDCAFPSPAKTAMLRHVDKIVGVSRYVSEYVVKWGGADAVHVPISLIEPGPHPVCGRFDNEFVMMVNPSATKGISVFLKLAAAMPDVKFAAVPTWGTNAEDLSGLRGHANVTVLDPVDDIRQILRRARVMLIPSLWAEARSRMVIESLVHGVPVLASDVGGLGEAMMGVPYLLPVNRITTYHPRLDENMVPVAEIPEQEIGPWKATLERLLTDREHWEELSAHGREAGLTYAKQLTAEPLEQTLVETIRSSKKREPLPEKAPLSPDKHKLLALRLKKAAAKANPWLPSIAARKDASLRMFCFPFAGGGAAFFRAWGLGLGSEVAVTPVLLPGREGRLSEKPIESFEEMVEQVTTALLSHLASPFVFFGHSMGAVLAFEVIRRLREQREPLPVALLVSGARAPQFRLGHRPAPEPSEAQLLEQVRLLQPPGSQLLEKPDLLRLLLPALRADANAYRRYVYEPGPPLPLPVFAYGGREDTQVSADHLEAWSEQTTEGFARRMFAGGHFFLRSQALMFLQAMNEDLSEMKAAARAASCA